MNSIGGSDQTPFGELSRRRQVATILSLCVLFPVGIAASIVFIFSPVYGVSLAITGQLAHGAGIVAVGIFTWVLAASLMGL